MTLTPFPPEALDALALRLLDVVATLRMMAQKSRENGLDGLHLHGHKAYEWLAHLEQWAHDASDRLDNLAIKQRGARRGQALAAGRLPPRPSRPARRRKSR